MKKSNELKILVVDDSAEQRADAVQRIETGLRKAGQERFSVRELPNAKELVKAITSAKTMSSLEAAEVDKLIGDYDIVVFDSDLSHLEGDTSTLYTADILIGFARALSRAPIFVCINRVDYDFDLKNLVGDDESKADIALKIQHLENPWLWASSSDKAGKDNDEFAPWYWPSLVEWPERRRKQWSDIEENLNKGILDYFGFPQGDVNDLTGPAIAFLDSGKKREEARSITFLNHFDSSERTLRKHQKESLLGEHVDLDHSSKSLIARVVAAELEIWFRRNLIGPQSLLADKQHIAGRLLYDQEGIASLDDFFGAIANCRFNKDMWCANETYWMSLILSHEKYVDASNQLRGNKGKRRVFAEDTSSFIDLEASTVEFTPQYANSWDVLYLQGLLNAYNYSPRSFLAQ